MSDIHDPWNIDIELVEGCNKLCEFCGLSSLRSGPGDDIRFMELDTAIEIANQVAEYYPKKRVEFAGLGEPSIHPNVLDIVGEMRERLPKAQFMMTTNGLAFRGRAQRKLDNLYDAGIDIVLMDVYADTPNREDFIVELLTLEDITSYDYYHDEDVPSPWYNYYRKKQRVLIVMDDPSETDVKKMERHLHNWAGYASHTEPKFHNLDKSCSLVFRKFPIKYDGRMTLCCLDQAGCTYVCGNVVDDDINDVWYGEKYMAARRVLQHVGRVFTPCARCTKRATRVGLTPRVEYPSQQDIEIINRTIKSSENRNDMEVQLLEMGEE